MKGLTSPLYQSLALTRCCEHQVGKDRSEGVLYCYAGRLERGKSTYLIINNQESNLYLERIQFKGPLLLSAMFPARFLAQSSESFLYSKQTMTINLT